MVGNDWCIHVFFVLHYHYAASGYGWIDSLSRWSRTLSEHSGYSAIHTGVLIPDTERKKRGFSSSRQSLVHQLAGIAVWRVRTHR
jgi:hypothetical protein